MGRQLSGSRRRPLPVPTRNCNSLIINLATSLAALETHRPLATRTIKSVYRVKPRESDRYTLTSDETTDNRNGVFKSRMDPAVQSFDWQSEISTTHI